MKKVLSVLLVGALATSLVACSTGKTSETKSASETSATTTTAGAEQDQQAEGSDDYGEYNWNLAMTVSETTTNYKMVEYFANLVKESQRKVFVGKPR